MNNAKMDFHKDVAVGEKGEIFLNNYIGRLSGCEGIVYSQRYKDKSGKHIEGLDLYCLKISDNNLMHGAIEVKSYYKNAIIKYNLDIGFELWSNVCMDRSEWTKGWLYSMTHSDDHNDNMESKGMNVRAIMPAAMTFLYYSGEKNTAQDKIPFAAVSFPDFVALWQRLKTIADAKFRWDLDSWNLQLPEKTVYWNALKPDVVKNMWNVNLKDLSDIACVTIIEDGELNFESTKQRRQYDTLVAYSNGRKLNIQKENERMKLVEEMKRC